MHDVAVLLSKRVPWRMVEMAPCTHVSGWGMMWRKDAMPRRVIEGIDLDLLAFDHDF